MFQKALRKFQQKLRVFGCFRAQSRNFCLSETKSCRFWLWTKHFSIKEIKWEKNWKWEFICGSNFFFIISWICSDYLFQYVVPERHYLPEKTIIFRFLQKPKRVLHGKFFSFPSQFRPIATRSADGKLKRTFQFARKKTRVSKQSLSTSACACGQNRARGETRMCLERCRKDHISNDFNFSSKGLSLASS